MSLRWAAAAGVCVLVAAAPASAALGVWLGVSTSTPRAGQPVTIWVFPYVPYADGRNEPADLDYPFRVQALGPRGRNLIVAAVRTQNPFAWKARVRFPRPGRWEIRWANAYMSERDARLAIRYSSGGRACAWS